MKRPFVVTFVAVCLGSAAVRQLSLIREVEYWPLTDPQVVISLIATAAAVVAGLAAFGVWWMRPWAYKAVAAFGVLTMARTAYEESVIADAGMLQTVAVAALIACIFFFLARYIQVTVADFDEDIPVPLH